MSLNSVTISFSGFEKVQRNLKVLRGFPGQKRSVRDAAYKALKSTEKAARDEVPVRKKPYSDNRKRGTLKKSIGRKKARNAPVALVGPRAGSSLKNDGWYGHFIEDGTKRGIEANNFMKRAWAQTQNQVFADYSVELDKSLEKYLNRALKR
jgi:HK97 gp10 family phage protein